MNQYCGLFFFTVFTECILQLSLSILIKGELRGNENYSLQWILQKLFFSIISFLI